MVATTLDLCRAGLPHAREDTCVYRLAGLSKYLQVSAMRVIGHEDFIECAMPLPRHRPVPSRVSTDSSCADCEHAASETTTTGIGSIGLRIVLIAA